MYTMQAASAQLQKYRLIHSKTGEEDETATALGVLRVILKPLQGEKNKKLFSVAPKIGWPFEFPVTRFPQIRLRQVNDPNRPA